MRLLIDHRQHIDLFLSIWRHRIREIHILAHPFVGIVRWCGRCGRLHRNAFVVLSVDFQTLSQIVRQCTQFAAIQCHVRTLLIVLFRLGHHRLNDGRRMNLHIEIDQSVGDQIMNAIEALEILLQKMSPIRFEIDFEVFGAIAEAHRQRVIIGGARTASHQIRSVALIGQQFFRCFVIHHAVVFVAIVIWRCANVGLTDNCIGRGCLQLNTIH